MPKTVFFREWREYRGLTQEAAAIRLGISRPYLVRIESTKRKQRRRYNQDFLETAANLYRCEVGDLYRHPNDPYVALERAVRNIYPERIDEAIRLLQALMMPPGPKAPAAFKPRRDGRHRTTVKPDGEE